MKDFFQLCFFTISILLLIVIAIMSLNLGLSWSNHYAKCHWDSDYYFQGEGKC